MATVTNTPSPALVQKTDEPKKDAQGNPIVPVAGAPVAPAPAPAPAPAIDPVLPPVPEGQVSAAPAPANLPPEAPVPSASTAPAPVAPVNNPLLAPLPPTMAPIAMNLNASTESKERIDAGRNASAERMQTERLTERKAPISPRLGIGGQPITDANPRGDAGGSYFTGANRALTNPERQAKVAENNRGKSRSTESREEFLARPLKSDEERQTAANIVAQDKFNAAQAQQAFLDSQGMGDTGAQEKPNPAVRAALAQSVVAPNRPTLSPMQGLISATGSKEKAQQRLTDTSGYRAQWAIDNPGKPSIFSQDDTVDFDKPIPIYRNSLNDPKGEADAAFQGGAMKTGQNFDNMTPEEQYWTIIHEISGHATDREGFNKKGDFVTGKPNAQYIRQATEVIARLRQLPDLNGGGKHPSSPAAALDLLSSYGFIEPGSGQKARYKFSSANSDIQAMLTDYLSMSPKEQKAWRKMASEIMPGTAQNKSFTPDPNAFTA